MLVALALCAGCEGPTATDGGAPFDGGTPSDASALDSGSIDGGPPSLATLPAAPDLGACPAGWRAIETDGIAACDPWPATGIATCAGDAEAHFAGEPGCRAVGAACDGEFAADLPASGVVFVRPLGPGVGDGSRADPFGTIAQALAVATPGTIVALARGRFLVDQVDLPSGVTLRGACAADTILESRASSSDFGVVSVFASTGGAVEDLSLEGDRPGLFVGAGGSVNVRGVVVRGTETWGMIADDGGALVAEDVLVRDVRAFGGFDLGEGLYARRGGTASLTRGVVERTIQHGVYVEGAGSEVTLTDVAVRDIAPSDTGFRGVGVLAFDGATATLLRVAIDRVREAGVAALVDARAEVDRVVVRDVAQSIGLTDFGAGLLARAGGAVEAVRVLIERASHAGVVVFEAGSELRLADAIVRDTQLAPEPEPDRWGMGVVADGSGTLALTRVAALGNVFAGIFARDSTVTLDDVSVRDTRAVGATAIYGRGLELQSGARVTARRVAFDRNREVAVALTDPGSVLDAQDLFVADTRAGGDGRFGYGVHVVDGAAITLTRATLRGSRGAGLFVARASVDATGLEISGGRLQDCVATGSCGAYAAAYDVAIQGASTAVLRDFRLEGAPTAALQLAGTSEADLSDGVISTSPIGFNVQVPGFDDTRLRTRVTFVSVGSELDRSALPILEIPPFGI